MEVISRRHNKDHTKHTNIRAARNNFMYQVHSFSHHVLAGLITHGMTGYEGDTGTKVPYKVNSTFLWGWLRTSYRENY